MRRMSRIRNKNYVRLKDLSDADVLNFCKSAMRRVFFNEISSWQSKELREWLTIVDAVQGGADADAQAVEAATAQE